MESEAAIGSWRMTSRISAPREPSTSTTRRMPPACSWLSTWPITGVTPSSMRHLGRCAESSAVGRAASEMSARSMSSPVSSSI
eukprot:2963034-Prymnesium_polylepis.1